MMNNKFSLALLATAAMARVKLDTSSNSSTEFQNYIGTFGKQYGSTQEWNKRLQVWLDNKAEVDGLNASNAGTGVTFGMNDTSDMTEEEFLEMQGFGSGGKRMLESTTTTVTTPSGDSRRLQSDMSIDWV